ERERELLRIQLGHGGEQHRQRGRVLEPQVRDRRPAGLLRTLTEEAVFEVHDRSPGFPFRRCSHLRLSYTTHSLPSHTPPNPKGNSSCRTAEISPAGGS